VTKLTSAHISNKSHIKHLTNCWLAFHHSFAYRVWEETFFTTGDISHWSLYISLRNMKLWERKVKRM